MSSATFETNLTRQKRRASWNYTIYLFIVMLHATTRNLNCFTNNQILHILNLFKTMIIPIILLAPILHIWLLSQWQL
jgi:hypothetical protein